ncbi:CBS domain-containing protein [Ensifer adhaerens]|uniref:CBS domain-containing protein n=1 Tax=Ensifer adhaerens TaxID=106592 RepID=UPI00384A4C7D
MHASDIMTRRVLTVSPEHSVRHAARLMIDNRISGLPVCNDEGSLVGILSEGDLLRRSELGSEALKETGSRPQQGLETYIKAHSWRVGDVMTKDPVTVEADASVDQIAAMMATQAIKRVPVVQRGRLLGVVSRRDILQVVLSSKPERFATGDEAIRRAVMARLLSDLNLDTIDVKVEGGMVALCGNVESGVKRLAARVAAEAVCGIGGVRNELRVINEADCKNSGHHR